MEYEFLGWKDSQIRCKNPEGGLELVTSDATVVEMVGHIPSNKVIVLYYSEIEDHEYDADVENCDGDLTQNYQVNEVDYIEVEDEETFENVGTKVANEDAVKEVPNEDAGAELPNEDIGAHFTIDNEGAELPNEDIGSHVTIDNEGAELPNEDEDADLEIKDSDYEFSENEAEDRPTVRENVVDEGTSHGAPGEVSSDGADTSEFDNGSETDSEGNGRKKIKLPKFKQYRRDVDLKRDLYLPLRDKQKGLVPAIERVLPTAEHRIRATTVPWWEAEMEKMKNEDEEAWKWLKKRPARNWSRSHFGSHFKCDLLLNNPCESFNATILDARDKTILSCLERIKVYVMLRMASRRSACQNWRYSVGPRIFKIIEKNKLGSSQCIPRLAGEKLYQVSHIYGGEFVVDLKAKTCSCGRWNLCVIPCPHAISAIFQRCENPIAYVDDCYKVETYMKAYEPVIHPIPSMDQWSKCGIPPIKPPLYKQQPGRPKRVRTKEPGEVEIPAPIPPNPMPPNYIAPPVKLRRVFIEIRCRGCSQKGHNIATCDRQNNETQQVHASSTQMEQGSSSNTVKGRGISRGRGNVAQATADPNSLQSMARGNREGGRGISRGRGNVAQAPVYPNSQESVTRGNGQGVLPSSHIGLGRGLSSSKLSAIRGRGLPSSRSSIGGKRKGTRRTSFGQHFP
ncbi:unnamed protein product [Prunus armeniaca]